MQCPVCGAPISATLYRCGHCGAVQPPPPGAVPVPARPDPEPEVPRVRLVDGLAQGIIALLWLIAAVECTLGVAVAATLPWTRLPTVVVAVGVVAAGLELVLVAMLMVWLFHTSSNVDSFGVGTPGWRPYWAFLAWFIPLANAVLPAVVIADVARASADSLGPAEGNRQARRVWAWWLLTLVRPWASGLALLVVAPVVAQGLNRSPYTAVDPHQVLLYGGSVVAVVLTLVWAWLGARMVGQISREQRGRVERVWAGNADEARAAGLLG